MKDKQKAPKKKKRILSKKQFKSFLREKFSHEYDYLSRIKGFPKKILKKDEYVKLNMEELQKGLLQCEPKKRPKPDRKKGSPK